MKPTSQEEFSWWEVPQRLAVPFALLTVAIAFQLFDDLPLESELGWSSGRIVDVRVVGSKSRSTELRVEGLSSRFQPQSPSHENRVILDALRSGSHVELAHTEEAIGMFGLNNRLRVFALTVDDEPIYTFSEYRQARADDAWIYWCVLTLSASGALFGFWSWRIPRRGLKQSGDAASR
ncbi:MAG: hypothetical protein AAF078_09560 [Planctomycetota bacterium]